MVRIGFDWGEIGSRDRGVSKPPKKKDNLGMAIWEYVVLTILLVASSIFWIRLTLKFFIQYRKDIAKAFWGFLERLR